MKKILLFIFLFTQFSSLLANEVTKNTAQHAAQELLKRTEVFSNTSYFINNNPEVIQNEESDIVAYVFTLKPNGFIVVSADDRIEPILAYSNNSGFNPLKNPDDQLLFLIKKDVSLWRKAIDEKKIDTKKYKQKWENLKSLNKSNSHQSIQSVEAVYGPYLTSKWAQGTIWNSAIGEYERVYNIYTPNHWAAGCNATAMVQILNYYEWPITGMGSHTYTENGRTHSVDYSSTTYDWANTLDIYKDVVTTQEQKNNASLISYHGAVSIDMSFGESGSTSSITDVPNALASYFRFIGHHETVSGYANFFTRLRENMENGRPSHLAISNSEPVGHAVVCDGYDSGTNYYHLNMGWSGSSDAWYNITGSFNAGGYTTIDAAVLDMLPEPQIVSVVSDNSNPLLVTVTWDVSNKLNPDQYELQRKDGVSGTWATINDAIAGTTFTETLPSQGDYYYRVRAKVDGNWYLNSYSNEFLFSTISNNDYRTKQSGDWTSSSTWEVYNNGWISATTYPTYSNGVITIQNGHSINITTDITVDEITIEQNAILVVKDGNDLSINNGSGTDLVVNGTLKKEGSARIFYTGTGTTTTKFNAGAVFQLAGTNKYILVANWDPNSTIEITGAIGGDMTSTYHTDQAFGNFVWNSSSQTSNVYFSGSLTNIQGDFNLLNTNGYEFRLTGTAGDDPTVTIKGDVNITNGILNLTSGDNNIYFVCYGDYNQSGGVIKATGGGTGYLRFGPIASGGYNGIFTITGGTFSPDNIQVNASYKLTLNSDITVSCPFIVNGAINMLNHEVSGSGTFTVSSSGRIIIGHANGINGNISTTGINLDFDADFEFDGLSAQVTGTLLPTTITDGLIIDNPNGVTLSQSTLIKGGKTGLVLTKGKLNTTDDNILTLDVDGYWSRGSEDNSFVNGPIIRTFNSASSVTKSFPTGKGEEYRRLALTITHDTDTPTQYKCEVFNQEPTNRVLPTNIDKVSTVRYWKVTKGVGANVVLAAINLNYSNDDGVTDPNNLRIVKSDGGGNWIDIGGTGTSSGIGNITSTINFTEFSDFVLANATGGINPLPVELTSFTAVVIDKGIVINWTTATEVNNYGFEIERSSTPLGTNDPSRAKTREWETIGFVKGHGNSNSPRSYSYVDRSIKTDKVSYRLKQIDIDGTFKYSEIIDVSVNLPAQYELSQNYPNPFNPSTTIKYTVGAVEAGKKQSDKSVLVTLKVYDILGRVVATLVNKKQKPGEYTVEWNASELPSGTYFYQFKTDDFSKIKKMIILK